MKAALLHQVGDSALDVRDDISTTALGAGKVRIRIKATGVCHSDLSAMTGTIPVAVPAVLAAAQSAHATRRDRSRIHRSCQHWLQPAGKRGEG